MWTGWYPEEYLTVNQAAQKLGVCPAQVRHYIRAGQLPATKLGRDYIIAPDDFAMFKRPPMGRTRQSYKP